MSIDPEMFHNHLDKCARCRNQPFNLCPVGHALLTGTQKPVTMKSRTDFSNATIGPRPADTTEMASRGGPCLACKRSNLGKCRSHR